MSPIQERRRVATERREAHTQKKPVGGKDLTLFEVKAFYPKY